LDAPVHNYTANISPRIGISVRYAMQVELDDRQMMWYVVNISNAWRTISPEYVGSLILKQLRETSEHNLSVPLHRAVMAVPAEFDELQRNCTKSTAQLAGDTCNVMLVLACCAVSKLIITVIIMTGL